MPGVPPRSPTALAPQPRRRRPQPGRTPRAGTLLGDAGPQSEQRAGEGQTANHRLAARCTRNATSASNVRRLVPRGEIVVVDWVLAGMVVAVLRETGRWVGSIRMASASTGGLQRFSERRGGPLKISFEAADRSLLRAQSDLRRSTLASKVIIRTTDATRVVAAVSLLAACAVCLACAVGTSHAAGHTLSAAQFRKQANTICAKLNAMRSRPLVPQVKN